ncbi:phosphate transport system substrate-binding protein [Alkalihalobacillus xiaoxiensis]|uniref:Phosphate transport system substrate-binding protein n=1 Tax=Shouchella xiaoxiensis TaxID=766895 RepID=A0ABS2ST77_9BACI|nr:substrate-binding domain-containing protein [Shouchella xiaoxiensis]MBM7838701.1 phosphate transport system substrate-binding protein [Shouchella xiaoxiensis]
MFVSKVFRIIILSVLLLIGIGTAIVAILIETSYFYLAVIIGCTICLWIYVSLMFYQWHRPGFRRMFLLSMLIVGAISVYTYEQRQAQIETIDEPYASLDQHKPFQADHPLDSAEIEYELTEQLFPLDGQSFLYPLYANFAHVTFSEQLYTQSEVTIVSSDDPLDSLIRGEAEVVFLPDFLLPELESIETKHIANDCLVFFVHETNPLSQLELEQIRNIYAGSISNWSQVGGEAFAIRAYQRPQIQDSQAAFVQLLDVDTLINPIEDSRINILSDQSQIAIYENFENALGFTFYSNIVPVIDSIQIKLLEVEDESTLAVPIHAVYSAEKGSNEELHSFINWMLSDEGQDIVSQSGFLPLN